MHLLRRDDNDGQFSLHRFDDEDVPPYAILSHTWESRTEEVSFLELKHGTCEGKPGYAKIQFCAEQTRKDGLQYFWIDTCCIASSSRSEVSTAINAIYQWYHNAARCYVYLSDVSIDPTTDIPLDHSLFRESHWFTRSWTLLELLAPKSVEFFSCRWDRLGDKLTLGQQIHERTGIPMLALQGAPLSKFSIEERLSWASGRQATIEEDIAYSLMGIFDVYMPLIYGEGSTNALLRLAHETGKKESYITDLHIDDFLDLSRKVVNNEPTLRLDNMKVETSPELKGDEFHKNSTYQHRSAWWRMMNTLKKFTRPSTRIGYRRLEWICVGD
jgi:hypothetical protein